MVSINTEKAWIEKREYPRIKASCPIRYQIGAGDEWQKAMLIDYSATGIRFSCEELIFKGTRILVEVMPECVSNVPSFKAEAVIVRTSLDNNHDYQIACAFHKPVRVLMAKPTN